MRCALPPKNVVSIALLIWATNSFATARECNGGGDIGPKPFVDVTSSFSFKQDLVETAQEIKDLIFWERKETVVLRNGAGLVQSMLLDGSQKTDILQTGFALSRTPDIWENRFALEGTGLVYDTRYTAPPWQYGFPELPNGAEIHHTFWVRNNLYSAAISKNQEILIYRYTAGGKAADLVCKTVARKNHVPLKLVTGQAYPKVSFFGQSMTAEGKRLVEIVEIDVTRSAKTCVFNGVSDQEWFVNSPVLQVYRFPLHNGLAVRTVHPAKNLFWADDNGCRYYYGGREPLMLPNPTLPVFLTWDHGMGTLKFPRQGESIMVLQPTRDALATDIVQLTESQTWLTNDARRLVLAPRMKSHAPSVMQITFNR